MIVKRMMGVESARTNDPESVPKLAISISPYLMSRVFIKDKQFQNDLLMTAIASVVMVGVRRIMGERL